MKTFRGFAAGLLVGSVVMVAAPSFAAAVKQYLLVDATYPVHVNGTAYESSELPILNYEGSTYIPMRAVGDILGVPVNWNEVEQRAEIGEATGNNAFRNVTVTGSNGSYTVTGEARVFEATMQYRVEDGHNYLLEGTHTVDEGAPSWSAFTLNITIPQADLPANGTLTLELFEYSAKDGNPTNEWVVPLDSFGG